MILTDQGPEDPAGDVAAVAAIVWTIVAASDSSSPGATASSGSCPPRDPCQGLRDQLKAHEKKLSDYIQNPLGSDNKGILTEAKALGDEARANSIYNGRVQSRMRQIANFKKLLEECERNNGKL